MSSKIKGLYVAFEKDYTEEDTRQIVQAISMIKGVRSVISKEVNIDDWMNREQIRGALLKQIMKAVQNS